MHFLVEPETLAGLYDRRVFVARGPSGVIGFLVAAPVTARGGWLIEQIIRGRGAVNGTSELLVGAAMSALAHEGYGYATLGLAALSKRARLNSAMNPLWLRWVFGGVRAHACRFYNFEGLDAFKAKFQPEQWEPVYAVTNEPRFTFGALRAIAGAFSEGAPAAMVFRAVLRAARTEGQWLWRRLKGA
jgi:phosphatidylglycerol lysyltransferase